MKNVLIVGATGMIGGLILEYCLESNDIAEITVISRRDIQKKHQKLKVILHHDYSSYESILSHFQNIDLGFFCIGAYTGVVSKEELKKVTVDYAVVFAQTLIDQSNSSTLCFLSGEGADRSEKSSMPFAKFKGMAENRIEAMGYSSWYTFQPGYIYPVTPRNEPSWMYSLMRRLYPLIKLMGKNASISSTALAKVMLKVGLNGHSSSILRNRDIFILAET